MLAGGHSDLAISVGHLQTKHYWRYSDLFENDILICFAVVL
jgi:hypothetical protein